MKNSTVYMLIGLTGSGKSTWAKKFVKSHPTTLIVCPDAFRVMFNGEYKYDSSQDDIITLSAFAAAEEILASGKDVILDCCNLTLDDDRRGLWQKLNADRRIGVLFPFRDIEWHVQNREKNPHWDVDWRQIIKSQRDAYQPPHGNEFDEIWQVAWENE